jgi:hypothetical protein
LSILQLTFLLKTNTLHVDGETMRGFVAAFSSGALIGGMVKILGGFAPVWKWVLVANYDRYYDRHRIG